MRDFSFSDHLLSQIDNGLRTLFVKPNANTTPSPADHSDTDTTLNTEDQKYSARLMRVNHAGEVAAQGLYHAIQSWLKINKLNKNLISLRMKNKPI